MAEIKSVKFGPFKGYQSSVEAVMAPPEFIVGGTDGLSGSRDVILDPSSGMWFRRKGCAIVGDTVDVVSNFEAVGLLETGMRFNARARKLFQLYSPSNNSGKSTYAVLYGNDSAGASFPATDTGFFGTLYMRSSQSAGDPQTSLGDNYNLLKEFDSTHYPTNTGTFVPSTSGLIVCPPLWYESGEGGYNRGAHRFNRQQLTAGSRNCITIGDNVVFPNLRSTPMRWDRTQNSGNSTSNANTVRYFPLGPFPPLPTTSIATQTASTGNDATWTDGDTFYYSVAFKYKDGSYSQPTLPRPANSILAGGIGQRVVGTIGGTSKYRSITWTGIPIGPDGVVARLLLRSPKQNRTAATDAITVSPYDLRVVGILTNNTQTSYIDTAGSDVGLIENDNIIRFDTVCPRRARYFWTGDQRVLSGYTLPSPCAIMLAPCGNAAAADLNVVDDSVTAQGTTGFVYRITSTAVELYKYTASTTLGVVFSIDYATYTTLQDVVDKVNSTTNASTCGRWVAQVCPGADPAAASSSLCQSTHQITNCTTAGVPTTTLTCTGGSSFANVPIGAYITGTGVTTGTYVLSKTSNTSITTSQNVTVAAATMLDFSAYTGDGDGSAGYWSGSVVGLIRAFCPAYPGFIYFKRSALAGYDKPDKQSVYFTIGSPGAAASGSSVAINSWGADNRRLPTISNPGIILGGVDIEGAAVVAYQNGVALFKIVRGANTGEDFDAKLFTINGSRGPCSWSAIVGGNGWAAYTTREGVFATDKNLREFSLSGAIYNPVRGIGDIAYEIDKSVTATDSDNDDSYLTMNVLRSKIALCARSSAGTKFVIWYDFSPGLEASGVEELASPDNKEPYGWSAPCYYNAVANLGPSVLGAIPSSNGMTYFGAIDQNNSAVADGRVDQIEVGNADNGEPQFVGYAYMPQFVADDFSALSPQRVQVLHRKPTGTALTQLKVSRDQTFSASNSYTLSPSGSNQFNYEIVQMKSSTDRGRTDMVWLLWQDGEVTQGNGFWSVSMQYQQLPL